MASHSFTEPREPLANLFQALGDKLAALEGTPIIQAGDHKYDTRNNPLRNLTIPNRIFEPQGAAIEEARTHLAAMDPVRRAQLEAEWD